MGLITSSSQPSSGYFLCRSSRARLLGVEVQPCGAGVCTHTFLEAFSNLLVLIVAGLPPIPALRDFWDASFQDLQETHRVLCLSVDETSAEAMVSRVLGPGQHWVFPWERLEGFSADLCRLSEPLKRRPGTAAVASCVRILRMCTLLQASSP